MPRASVRMAAAANPGDLRSCRSAYCRSCRRRSDRTQPHTSWVCSFIKVMVPNARRAAWLASSGDRPLSLCSSSSRSRSERSSRSRSASLLFICHHFISALLGGRPHHACDSFGHLFPLRFLDDQLLLSLFRQAVVFEFPVSVRSHLPFGDDPPPLFQAMQRGVE